MARRRTTDVQLVRRAVELGDPAGGLLAIAELRRRLEALEAAHVDDALADGWSWQRIGTALGITRQAAHARHASRRRGNYRVAVAGRARVVLERARQEAARLGAPAMETDHVLLALVLEGDGPAAEALTACRLQEDEVRMRLEAPGFEGDRRKRLPPLSQATREVLEEALREALQRGSNALECDHLLLGVLREPAGRGQRLVMSLGKTPRAVERRLNRARDRAASGLVPDDSRSAASEVLPALRGGA
jgi:hypothetical protein